MHVGENDKEIEELLLLQIGLRNAKLLLEEMLVLIVFQVVIFLQPSFKIDKIKKIFLSSCRRLSCLVTEMSLSD